MMQNYGIISTLKCKEKWIEMIPKFCKKYKNETQSKKLHSFCFVFFACSVLGSLIKCLFFGLDHVAEFSCHQKSQQSITLGYKFINWNVIKVWIYSHNNPKYSIGMWLPYKFFNWFWKKLQMCSTLCSPPYPSEPATFLAQTSHYHKPNFKRNSYLWRFLIHILIIQKILENVTIPADDLTNLNVP